MRLSVQYSFCKIFSFLNDFTMVLFKNIFLDQIKSCKVIQFLKNLPNKVDKNLE